MRRDEAAHPTASTDLPLAVSLRVEVEPVALAVVELNWTAELLVVQTCLVPESEVVLVPAAKVGRRFLRWRQTTVSSHVMAVSKGSPRVPSRELQSLVGRRSATWLRPIAACPGFQDSPEPN